MTSSLGRFGIWSMISAITPEMAGEIERLGFGAIWVGGSPSGDLEAVERLLEGTEKVVVATGIVNMWKDEAEAVAASYRRVIERHPDRFLLGVGIGHREAIAAYATPYGKMVDYLDRLRAAGVPDDDVVLAALGPKVLALSGERTAGAHPYLTTPTHTATARRILGSGPLLAPEHKVVLETDPAGAREIGRPVVARYLNRVNYRNNLLREGWGPADLEDRGSDRLVDALVLHGSPEGIASGLRAHLDAGADHVSIQVLGEQPIDAYRRLAGTLLG